MQQPKLTDQSIAIDLKTMRLVMVLGPPVEKFQKSHKSGILFPNWEWEVVDVGTAGAYHRTEYWLLALDKVFSLRVTKKEKVQVEFGWTGNFHTLMHSLEEVCDYFQEFKVEQKGKPNGTDGIVGCDCDKTVQAGAV